MELDDDDTSSPAVVEESQKNEEVSFVYSSSNNPKEEISILYSSWNDATEFSPFSALDENQYNFSKELSNASLDSQSVFPNECKDDDFLIPGNDDDSTKDEISILYSSSDSERKLTSNMQNREMENYQELADSYSDLQILNETCKHKLRTDFSSQCMPAFSGAGFSFNDFETNDAAQRNTLRNTVRNTASLHQESVTNFSEENVYQNDFTWPGTPASLQMEAHEVGQSGRTIFSDCITSQTNARKYPKRVWLRGSQLVTPQHQAKKYQRRSAGNYVNNMQCPPLRRIILSCHICGEIGFHSLELLYEHQYTCERNISSETSYSSPPNGGNTSTEDSARSQPTECRPCPPLKRIIKCDICGEIGFPNLAVLEEHQFNCVTNLSVDSDSGSFKYNTYKEDVNFEEIMELDQNRLRPGTELSNLIPFEQIAKLACSSCDATNFTSMSSLLDHRLHCRNNYAESSAYEHSFATNLTYDGHESETNLQYNAGQESSEGSCVQYLARSTD
ncbi:uncharacterized protein [Anabrus simplex]|uniref:uncharacterized protein isoform X2 n=1 Tax=Anabrus simplex TaxID=316456 RepID=UPI0035A2D5AC